MGRGAASGPLLEWNSTPERRLDDQSFDVVVAALQVLQEYVQGLETRGAFADSLCLPGGPRRDVAVVEQSVHRLSGLRFETLRL
jgi:hypothetical protein